MPKVSAPLTDTFIKSLKAAEKPKKYFDGGGLHLLVEVNGSKYWRMSYTFGGKFKTMAFGVYDDKTLAGARKDREAAKVLLAAGKDPMQDRKTEKNLSKIRIENCFEAMAKEWMEQQTWMERHKIRMWQSFKNNILPAVGDRPITEIAPPEVLALLRKIEARGVYDLAHRSLQQITAVFRYAIQTGRATYNPGQDMKGALKGWTKKHRPAIMKDDLPEFLARLQKDTSREMTKLGIMLVIFTWLRSAELRGGLWSEIDFIKREWIIPASRMKMKNRDDHLVPLSIQAVAVLEKLQVLAGNSRFIFPGRNNSETVMCENTMTDCLHVMGYKGKATVHGFRTTASSTINEAGLFNPDAIERQLAHIEKNQVRAAYHRAEYLEERRRMMDWWGDYIAKLALAGAGV